jgi:hypothetical protein
VMITSQPPASPTSRCKRNSVIADIPPLRASS